MHKLNPSVINNHFLVTIHLDAMTATHLELICNLHSAKSDHSLYGVLNHTKTPAGGNPYECCQIKTDLYDLFNAVFADHASLSLSLSLSCFWFLLYANGKQKIQDASVCPNNECIP